tara:strand:- start:959 stop:1129 length:171 start_codon:yes stop_codon:yes gene_type:complete
MESNNNSNKKSSPNTIFAPLTKRETVKDVNKYKKLDEILPQNFKKSYFSEVNNKDN